MSQVQNRRLHNYIQPIALMAVAYIAGSKRFIRYFPGASQGGLLLAAGLGVGATYASPHISTPAFLTTDQKNEYAVHSLIRVITSLALGTIAVHVADKALKGRVSLSLPAAGRFILLEFAVALSFAGVSYFQTTPKTLKEKHAAYLKDLDTWNKLPEEERGAFAKQCFDKDFSALPLEKGEFDTKLFEKLPDDFSTLTKNQLEWYGSLYHLQGPTLSAHDTLIKLTPREIDQLNREQASFIDGYIDNEDTPTDFDELSPEQQVAFNITFSKYAIDPYWIWPLTEKHLEVIQKLEGAVDWVYQEFNESAVAFAAIEDKVREPLAKLFEDKGWDSIEDAYELLTQIDIVEILSLDSNSAWDWSEYFKVVASDAFLAQTPEKQVAFHTVFSKHEIDTYYWMWPLTEAHLEAIKDLEGAVDWVYQEFADKPAFFAAIEDKVREPLAKLFEDKGWDSIEDAQTLLTQIDAARILSLDSNLSWDWRKYFEVYQDAFLAQTPEKQVAFNTVFSKHEIGTCWIWPLTEAHLEAIKDLEGAVDWVCLEFADKPAFFAAIPEKVRQPLAELFQNDDQLQEVSKKRMKLLLYLQKQWSEDG